MTAVAEVGPVEDRRIRGRIDVEGFDFWYGKRQALHGIDMQITPREVTALIGPSGCGKSTFLRSINRLNELIPGARRAGEIRLDGENIYAKGMDIVTLR
ncbi:MAG TPA: ATP-binding cassette domain-containing protein, partial [Gemmatimonadaceae bacterium]